uniref:Purine nucleoside phosphorylase n=1 Tax=Mesocestoides corti TaxID=53468 RepID=A0A5K3F8F4_MESCO
MSATYEACSRACEHIRSRVPHVQPQVGIICGTGLGSIADELTDPKCLPYEDIPGFPKSAALGEDGVFVFGRFGGKEVCVMRGRFHPYEGHPRNLLALPIRVMQMLGVKTLFLTNAAGGVNETYVPGDLVIISDHVDFSSIVGLNPLMGPNDERFGTRFPAMIGTYDKQLRDYGKECARELKIDKQVKEGVFFHICGPAYETPATFEMLRSLGCDVYGMSTTQEVVTAKHLGMRIFAVSLITDPAIHDSDSGSVSSRAEMLRVAKLRAPVMAKFLGAMLQKL